MLIDIKTDALFVGDRLKEIDNSYYLVFNTIKNKYEVHSSAQAGCSYCLTCPHDALDERLVQITLKTRRENVRELMEEIEKENEKLEKKLQKETMEKVGNAYDG